MITGFRRASKIRISFHQKTAIPPLSCRFDVIGKMVTIRHSNRPTVQEADSFINLAAGDSDRRAFSKHDLSKPHFCTCHLSGVQNPVVRPSLLENDQTTDPAGFRNHLHFPYKICHGTGLNWDIPIYHLFSEALFCYTFSSDWYFSTLSFQQSRLNHRWLFLLNPHTTRLVGSEVRWKCGQQWTWRADHMEET